MSKVKIICRSTNGQVFLCNQCKGVHLEFNNLSFNLPSKDFHDFANYFNDLNGEHWETQNLDSIFRRKIIVPLGAKGMNMLLNKQELKELKDLLSIAVDRLKVVSFPKIDFCNNLN